MQQQYKPDFDKIKCLEIVAKRGQMLYIPAYWWYSFEFDEGTSLCSFKYRTYMNNVAVLPQIFMKLLQSQNVKRNIAKSAPITMSSGGDAETGVQTESVVDDKKDK